MQLLTETIFSMQILKSRRFTFILVTQPLLQKSILLQCCFLYFWSTFGALKQRLNAFDDDIFWRRDFELIWQTFVKCSYSFLPWWAWSTATASSTWKKIVLFYFSISLKDTDHVFKQLSTYIGILEKITIIKRNENWYLISYYIYYNNSNIF